MKKKLSLFHALVIVLALTVMALTSILVGRNINREKSEEALRGYFSTAQEVLVNERKSKSEEEAEKKTAEILKKSLPEIRITFIALDGDVIYDSNENASEMENHSGREEIKNPGKIYYRYSSTLKTDMMYVAEKDNSQSLYLRIAFPLSAVNRPMALIITISLVVLAVVLAVSLLLDYLLIDKEMKPLKLQVNRLSEMAGGGKVGDNYDVDVLSDKIDRVEGLLEEKISAIEGEKEKLGYIIDSMNEGLLILDEKENVVLMNQRCRQLFQVKNPKEEKSLIDLTIDPELLALLRGGKDGMKAGEYTIAQRTYLIRSEKLVAEWLLPDKVGIYASLVDITEQKRLEKSKKDFFANASHELKSPLTSVLGYTEMIKNGFLTDKNEIDDALESILKETKRMNAIIIEMLDLARLENPGEERETQVLSLKKKTEEVYDHLKSEAEKKKIAFKIEGDDYTVRMNEEDLEELIKNLLENAIRYNKDGGKVSVLLDHNQKTLAIQDTGIGIPKEDQERIYERFYRVDKARSRKLGGTGLGLSIVKHICLNDHIGLSLDSTVGEGSIFTLSFSE